MKLKVEIDISPEEVPYATEILTLLKEWAGHITPSRPNELLTGILQKCGGAESSPNIDAALDQIGDELRHIFATMDDGNLVQTFYDIFWNVVFESDLVAQGRSVLPYLYLLPRLPEPQLTTVKDKLIPQVLKVLTKKRPIDCNRMEVFAHAEAFGALVKMEFVSISGAISSINQMLNKPETRCAAITMLGKTVELCLHLLHDKCDPKNLNDLRATLLDIKDAVFAYDIQYIRSNMSWDTPAPAPSVGPGPLAGEAIRTTNGGVTPPLGVIGSGARKSTTTPTAQQEPVRTFQQTLNASESYSGHTGTVYAMCYDERRNKVVSAAKDGAIIVWSAKGKQEERLTLANHYACSMDMNTAHNSIFLSGVVKDHLVNKGPQPAIVMLGVNATNNWHVRSALEKSDVKLVSCVKSLQGPANIFVTGESIKEVVDRKERVCVYDAQSSEGFERMHPVIQYTDHEDIVTCLSTFHGHDGLFFSGSRDWTVRVWDTRSPAAIALLGVSQADAAHFAGSTVPGHESMITSLDVDDNLLVSAGLDKTVIAWDVRNLSAGYTSPLRKITVDDTPVLKVAIGPTPSTVAVSTLSGLYLVDLNTSTYSVTNKFKDRPVGRYHDLKWNADKTVLYACGDDLRVDLYKVGTF